MYFRFGSFFNSLLFSCNIVYPFSIFVIFFGLPYFRPKSFSFFCIQLLVCFRVTPSQFLIEFSFVVLESTVLSVLFYTLSMRVFHPSIYWWSFTGDWGTVSLKSPGRFPVFKMMYFKWSLLVLWFRTLLVLT